MARPESRVRFLRELIAGEPVTARELAARLGIGTNYVERVLENFVAQGYASRCRPGPAYQLVRTPAGFDRIYSQRQYRDLRLDLRRQGWVIEATMGPYVDLPPELALIVAEMLQCSHSFFEILRRYRSTAELEQFYAPYLMTLRLFAGDDELICRYHLYHQLYAESVIRDLGRGGLPKGFLGPLDRMRDLINERFHIVHAHQRERETIAVVRALAPRMKTANAGPLLDLCLAIEASFRAGGNGRADFAALLDQLGLS